MLAAMNFLTIASIATGKAASVDYMRQRGILHDPRRCQRGHEWFFNFATRVTTGGAIIVAVEWKSLSGLTHGFRVQSLAICKLYSSSTAGLRS